MNSWGQTFRRGIVHYNYRRIDDDIFGKSCEMFLAADSLVGVDLEKQAARLAEYHQAELKKLSELRARYIENPPWEGLRPIRKEFAVSFNRDIFHLQLHREHHQTIAMPAPGIPAQLSERTPSFGSGATKAELDQIIRQALAFRSQ